MEPSLSSSSAITQQGGARMTDKDVKLAPDAMLLAGRQMQAQQGELNVDALLSRPAASGTTQDSGLQRLTAALTAVLSTGMASDFVEGLKPVLHNGKLAISTYVKLEQDPEPVFIGMFPSLPAAVAAQKQSQELVGHLPPAVARKLISQQLAHTDPAGAVLQQSGSHRPPERWQSNTTSESTAVGAGSSSQAAAEETEPSHKAPQQQQQQEGSAAGQLPLQLSREVEMKLEPQSVPLVSAGVNLQQQQQQRQAEAGEQADAAIQSALAAAAAAGAHAHQAPSASAVAAAVAAASPGKPSSALTDDVIRMLVQKGLQGLHALTVAQQQQPGEQASSWQQQEPGQQQQQQPEPEPELNLMDVFNTPVSTPGSASALVGALQHLPSPQQQQAYMQQLVSSTPQGSISGLLGQHYPTNTTLQMPSTAQQQFAGGYANQLQQPDGAGGIGVGGVPGSSLPPLLPLVGDGAAGNVLSGDLGLALDGALNEAMLRGVGPWGTSTAPGLPYGTAPMAFSAAFPEQHLSISSLQQQQQQGAMSGALDLTAAYGAAGGAYGAHNSFGAAVGGRYGPGGGYALQQQLAMQFPPGAAYVQEPDADRGAAVGPAAAAAAAGDGEGVGEKRKRAAVDPRVNCVKSVQYRVSRFPSELHDLCIEHWERARCARVVCNEVQGVMSVQNGRCVVTFNQADQEVVKGVADFLRYAGEERIKKWRRHVRMVDFPRPGNRSGELMTAEEFLCIVGYQSEQGGGKRAKADYD